MNQTTSITADFQHHLLADGKSAKTVASYVSDVQAFLNWIEEKGAEFSGDIKRFHITSYKKFLLESDYSPNTVNKKINSLKAFNDYLLVSGKAQSMAVDVRRDKVKV